MEELVISLSHAFPCHLLILEWRGLYARERNATPSPSLSPTSPSPKPCHRIQNVFHVIWVLHASSLSYLFTPSSFLAVATVRMERRKEIDDERGKKIR